MGLYGGMLDIMAYREVIITEEMLDSAKDKLGNLESDPDKSASKFGSESKRILEGYIGERIVMSYLKLRVDEDNYEYDLRYKGKKLEVKTISGKFKPPMSFEATVNSHDPDGVHMQDADFYVFVRILNNYSKGWILGCKSCPSFFAEGTFIKEGHDFGKFQFTKANATVMKISLLDDIKLLEGG